MQYIQINRRRLKKTPAPLAPQPAVQRPAEQPAQPAPLVVIERMAIERKR